jgi:hypothetical protein
MENVYQSYEALEPANELCTELGYVQPDREKINLG